jgi:hypothetical protein
VQNDPGMWFGNAIPAVFQPPTASLNRSVQMKYLALPLILSLLAAPGLLAHSAPQDTLRLADPPQPAATIAATATYPVLHFDAMWRGEAWLDPEINFVPVATAYRFAGDITGNGRAGRVNVYSSVADERDPDLGARTHKSLVFFGGNLTAVPDQVLYTSLLPIGDVNGSGYTDAIGTSFDGSATYWRGTPSGFVDTGISAPQGNFVGFLDLDSDGYQDFVTRLAVDSDRLIVYRGHASFEAIVPETFTVPFVTSGRGYTANMARLADNSPAILLLISGSGQAPYRLVAARLSGSTLDIVLDREVERSSMASSPTVNRLAAVDVTGNGLQDLLLFGSGISPQFFAAESGTSYAAIPVPLFSSSTVRAIPVGVLDGGSAHAFAAYSSSGGASVYYGPGDGPHRVARGAGERYVPVDPYPYTGFGDMNGNGVDDLLLALERTDQVGARFVLGSAGRLMETVDYAIQRADYTGGTVIDVHATGDVNRDGIQDFAFLVLTVNEEGYGRGEVRLFEGTAEGGRLFQTLFMGPRDLVQSVASGDFNGNGNVDLAVVWSMYNAASNSFEGRLTIYLGTPSFPAAPDHVFTFAQLTEAFSITSGADIIMVHNAGDVNGDGFDDLLFSSNNSGTARRVFVKLGGSDLASSRSIALDYSGAGGGGVPGMSFASLGKGTGAAHDFAVADGRRVFVHRGRAVVGPDPVVWTADATLTQLQNAGEFRESFGLHGIAVGDFDGDGMIDIAVASGFSYNADNPEHGVKTIHLYYGQPGFTAEPDELFGVPLAPFTHAQTHGGSEWAPLWRGELLTVPGVGPDAADRLLVGSGGSISGNALLYRYTEGGMAPVLTLHGPNSIVPLGGHNTSTLLRRQSAAGDFTGDGRINVILPQLLDRNWRGSPVYRYTLDPLVISAEPEPGIITRFALHGAFPNPFNPTTTIVYDVPADAHVAIDVYDLLGRRVELLLDARMPAGQHRLVWDAGARPSGTYMLRMRSAGEVLVRTLVLMK